MPEQMASFNRHEEQFTNIRDGDSFVEKVNLDGVDMEIKLPTLFNEEVEWKEKEENPNFHVKALATFEDGVWYQKLTPLNEDGGKTQFLQSWVEEDKLFVGFSLPDVPGVTAKRTYQKV